MLKKIVILTCVLLFHGCGLYKQPVVDDKHELELHDTFEKTNSDFIKNLNKIMKRLADINKELSNCSAHNISIKITAKNLFKDYDEYIKETKHKPADDDLFIKTMINKQLDSYSELVNTLSDRISNLILEHKKWVKVNQDRMILLGKKPLKYSTMITVDRQQLLNTIGQVKRWAQEFKASFQSSYIAPQSPRSVCLKAYDLSKKEDIEEAAPALRALKRFLVENQEAPKKKTLRVLAKHQQQYIFAQAGLKLVEIYQSQEKEASLVLKAYEDIIRRDPFGRADLYVNVCDAIFDDHDVNVLSEFFMSSTGSKFLKQSNSLNAHFQQGGTVTAEQVSDNVQNTHAKSFSVLQKTKRLVSILYNEKLAAVYAQTFMGIGNDSKLDRTEFKQRIAQFLTSNTFHSLMIHKFTENFTDKDLDILLTFFESSTGEKYLSHQAEIAKATLEMMLGFVYDVVEYLVEVKRTSNNQKSCNQEKTES